MYKLFVRPAADDVLALGEERLENAYLREGHNQDQHHAEAGPEADPPQVVVLQVLVFGVKGPQHELDHATSLD